jgi:protein transport protein SEC24
MPAFPSLKTGPPLSQEQIPVVDYGEMGPVRCSRCKAYINVFVTFSDNGAK